ncbi:hypothetical protein BpHYR1_043441 [Brachionus plicatilis]|uniref:Uncharacterized protein n=1 Tax=Brachionus plicatilis TaxID=10195 RepID=A0A3M7R943_BRAPC|nr:hypothetical protein BpHYR1_043441 [Brachionus plicatilis]
MHASKVKILCFNAYEYTITNVSYKQINLIRYVFFSFFFLTKLNQNKPTQTELGDSMNSPTAKKLLGSNYTMELDIRYILIRNLLCILPPV